MGAPHLAPGTRLQVTRSGIYFLDLPFSVVARRGDTCTVVGPADNWMALAFPGGPGLPCVQVRLADGTCTRVASDTISSEWTGDWAPVATAQPQWHARKEAQAARKAARHAHG